MQQAKTAHSATTIVPSPVNDTTFPPAPSRRSIIGGGALAALALVPAFPASASSLVAQPSPTKWDILYEQFLHAADVAHVHTQEVFNPAVSAYNDALGPLPDTSFEYTARNGQVAKYRVDPENRSPFPSPAMNREHDAAADRWDAWRAKVEIAEREPRYASIVIQNDGLWDAEHKARCAVMNEPAPHARAFAIKVQLALGNEDLWDLDRTSLLIDAARLAA